MHDQPASPCAPPAPCCPEPVAPAFRYREWPFLREPLTTPAGIVRRISSELTPADRLGHWQMRWGIGRMRYRVAPGLYALGQPAADSPVLVTANYKLTIDLLRRELAGVSAWLLVLDTRGINVWCAAGKGTFGTAEILRRVAKTRVAEVVNHRILIVPQLGAPGVAAHEVRKGCGFQVIYGPVRAADLRAFLAAGMRATPNMRRVTFTTKERLVLTPVELTSMLKSITWGILVLLLLGGIGPQLFSTEAALVRGGRAIVVGTAGICTGAILVPLLLPWLPGRMFAMKGAVAGFLVAVVILLGMDDRPGAEDMVALFLALPAVAAWCAMNFTGSTTFTSPSGVEREMRRTIPLQAAALLAAGACWVAGAFF